MKQHLKVRGRLNSDHRTVTVTVLDQTHRGEEFGNLVFDNGIGMFKANGIRIRIVSDSGQPDWGTDSLYVRGNSEAAKAMDDYSFRVSLKDWQIIRTAVEQFNAWGETQ